MKDCSIGDGAKLDYVIADKNVTFAPGTVITGNEKLPILVPKGASV